MTPLPAAGQAETHDAQWQHVAAVRKQIVAAQARERAAWEAVRGRHPGQPGHDPATWGEWVESAGALMRAAQRLRELN